MQSKSVLAATVFALAALAAGCSADPESESRTCPGTELSDGDNVICLMTADEAGATDAAALVYITETGAIPRPWVDGSIWRDVTIIDVCVGFGFTTGATRGALLGCSLRLDWSDEIERVILVESVRSAGGDPPDADTIEEWASSCDSWCASDCAAVFGIAEDECTEACAFGLTYAAAIIGDECGDAQAALTACEAASDCVADESCAAELVAANDACWTCASSTECPAHSVCGEGRCVFAAECGGLVCASDELCVDDVCETDDLCALINCVEGTLCVEGECVPTGASCDEDTSFAEGWNVDPIDSELMASFPVTYGSDAGRFVGDDSQGFMKQRDDGRVSYTIEFGPGAVFERATYTEMPTAEALGYDVRIEFESAFDCAAGAIFTKAGAGSLRNVDALIVLEVEGTLRDIVFVGYAADEAAEVEQIARTLRP
jgi:hypothetical protein